MKKICIIFITILLLITNLSVIFADETDENESNEPDTTETTEVSNDIKTLENENKKDIESINIEIENIKSTLNIKAAGNNGYISNYDKLNSNTLLYLFEHWNDFIIISLYRSDNPNILNLCKYEDVLSINEYTGYYQITVSKYYNFFQDTQTFYLRDNNYSFNYYFNNNSDESMYGYYKFSTYYNLQPYKLTYSSNGLGPITNSVNTEPYLSTNIYYSNQTISLTYDDSNNDFTGWYDTNGNLVSNDPEYTFNITSDTTLIANYYTNPVEHDYNNLFFYIIILLSFLVLSNLFNGGKLYD